MTYKYDGWLYRYIVNHPALQIVDDDDIKFILFFMKATNIEQEENEKFHLEIDDIGD